MSWFAEYGEGWAEGNAGAGLPHDAQHSFLDLSIAAGLGVVLGGIFLMPAVTSLIASVFVDDVAEHVEREHYPAERPGDALPLGVAVPEGIKTALLTILVYLIALPFVLFAGAGFLIFFVATAWLLGREYFELAAMRFRSPPEAKAMRKDNAATVFPQVSSSPPSCRSRSSIWRRRCSAWPSWSTCTSACPARAPN